MRRTGQWGRWAATFTGLAVLSGLLAPVAYADGPTALGAPELPAPHGQKVSPFTAKANKRAAATVTRAEAAEAAAAARARKDQQRKVTWPSAGQATVTLPAKGVAKAAPGSLPVTVSQPSKGRAKRSVTVKVMDQKSASRLGVRGVVLQVTGTPGSTRVGLDYSKFASAYGGDWAGRLQLQQLPECAASTPALAKCRTRSVLNFTNDRAPQQLSAPIALSAGSSTMLALSAGTKSGGGDYKATPLSASSTWEAGSSSGNFTWSYPLRVPPAAAGPRPDMSISYDSGSIDGQSATTNNQSTGIGAGFDLTSSYIERQYGSCDDDDQADKYDLCWKYDNASLVLNGKSTELVKDDTRGTWRLKDDDASSVTHSTGADNGDDGETGKDGKGEYWTVTTGDGTKYVFGLDKLDGAGSDDRTNSVWTVPVFGDDSGEPGYSSGSSLAGRSKQQAWRWNLDYVEDTHANAETFWYTAETNNYDTLGDDTTGTRYTRGGYLKEIRYGQRAGALFSATPAATNKVVFSYAERCMASGTGCDALTDSTRDNWPDVPFDSLCKDGDKCTGNVGPSFFTRKRMTSITTYAWNAASSAGDKFEAVDDWDLKQRYIDPGDTGDSSDQSLWLEEIKHTGKHGTELALSPVKFTPEFHANRVDGDSDNILPLNRPRLKTVASETGAQTLVTYADADCIAGQAKPALDANTKRCYPVYWSPNGGKVPELDWFQKYPVTSVSTTDPQGGAEAVQHTYQYSGGGAWHYNEDPLTPEKQRTWSNWRGFAKVTHITGASNGTQSKTVTVFLRGMNGDRVLTADGKLDPMNRKSAKVTGIKAGEITDYEQYAGFTRESVTYNGSDEVSGEVNDPWSKKTATQHKSYADTEAYYVRTGASHSRTNITSKLTPYDRVRTVKSTFDDYGMPETVEDQGDDAASGDETCTRTWYARNDDMGINSLPSRVRKVAKPCSTADTALDLPADSTRPGDVISDTATVYDDTTATTWSATQKPTVGEPAWSGRAKGYGSDDAPTWQKIATTTFDALGRPRVIKDTNGQLVTDTAYVPATTGPLTSSSVTNVKGHKSTTAADFATGSALKITDPNNKVTETTYDSLGRTTQVWLPNRLRVLNAKPNYVFGYHLTNTATEMSWVSTGTLSGDGSHYNTTYEFYDSLLRSRQVQTPSPVGGRLVSLTLYDSRGLAVGTRSDIWDSTSAPNGTAVETDGNQAPIETNSTYDGAGRVSQAITSGRDISTTNTPFVRRVTIDTTYTGDTVAATAATGGQATAVVTNALGQTTERREYAGPSPTGTAYTTTKFTYTPAGQQQIVTGPDTSQWSYDYDLFGRQVKATDPDKGTGSTRFDSLDRVDWTKDAEDHQLLYGYDELNRKTGLWQTDRTDANKLAAWGYDSIAKGQQDTATRYDGALTKAYTQKVKTFDSLYHPTATELQLPDSEPLVAAGLSKTLAFSGSYNLDGTPAAATMPAVGGLSAEAVSYGYNATGQVLKSRGSTNYLLDAAWSPQGDLSQLRLGTDPTSSAKKAYLNYSYEPGFRRLTRSYVTDDVHGYMLQDLNFTRDDAGNVDSIFDGTTLGGTTKPDNQCFTYDGYSRLTEAWTPKTADCASTGRTSANIDGQAPYWTSYTYNTAGQRKTETQHTATADKTTSYTYNAPTDTKPHTLDQTTGARTASYVYDKTGNTTSRPGPTAQQSLLWNSEGKLTTTTEGAKETGYLYDANGELLIRRAKGDGDTILYLGGEEVRLTAKGTSKTLSGTRYYTAAGQTIAVRNATQGVSGSKLSFLAADDHGTSSIVLDATTYAVTKRYMSPFGAPRGTKPSNWPDDKAFLGKSADDSTGLTHIGAREYDPAVGQFVSVDPLLEVDKHQSLNGYAYGKNSPVVFSDPSGLGTMECMTGVITGCQNGVPNSKSEYHADRERKGCRSHCSSGTASGGSGGKSNAGGGGSGWGWLTGPLDTIVNYGTAIVSTPEIWWGAAETAGSIFLINFGGGAVVGGAALCLTGVGCIAGAPAVAGGAVLVGAGAVGAGDGIGRIGDGLGKALREANAESSGGRKAQEYGDKYEDFLVDELGGGGSFSEKGREFDGAYIDSTTGKGTWYEAKSGSFFENILKNPTRLNKFFSTEGQKAGIARDHGMDYRVFSENPIPGKVSNWLDRKGIPWEVKSR